MIARRWLAFWISCAAAVVTAVSGYDAFSSQFEWQKIPRLWETFSILLPLWGWVAVGQSMLIGWLFWNQRHQQLIISPTVSENSVPSTIEFTKINQLSARVTLAQNHVNSLLARADNFDLGMTRLAEAETIIADLSSSASGQDILLKNIASDLDNRKIYIEKLSITIDNIISLTVHTDSAKLLRIILQKMDKLADGTYGGSISPLSNPTFLPDQADIIQFESLASLAADIARIQKLPLNIPSNAGLYWFSPPNPDVPHFSQDRHGDPTIQRIMRLRCDHHLIRQYINALTPDHVGNVKSVQR